MNDEGGIRKHRRLTLTNITSNAILTDFTHIQIHMSRSHAHILAIRELLLSLPTDEQVPFSLSRNVTKPADRQHVPLGIIAYPTVPAR